MSQDTLFLSSLTLFLTIEGGQKRLFLSSLKAVLSSFFWIKKALERCPGQFFCRIFIRFRVLAIVGFPLSRTKICHL